MNFADERLLVIHKMWVKVQVSFYYFIMHTALDKPNPTLQDIEDYSSGSGGYEGLVERCADLFESPDTAWNLFLINQGIK